MSWSRDTGIGSLLSDVLALQVRVQRLKLLQQVEAVRAQAQATGVPTEGLQSLQSKVLSYALPAVTPPQTSKLNKRGLRNLLVESEEFT